MTTTASGDSQRSDEQPATWRIYFLLALWVFLIAQFAIDTLSTLAGAEPFPTITMPAFSAEKVGQDGHARVTERSVQIIRKDQTTRTVEVSALLSPLYSAPAGLTLDRLLKADADAASTLRPATIGYLQTQAKRLDPGAVGLRIVWQPEDLNIRTLDAEPFGAAKVREVHW